MRKMRSNWSSVAVMGAVPPRGSGTGGSLGCSAMRTPHSSATGSTRSRKYRRRSHICSSVATFSGKCGGACISSS